MSRAETRAALAAALSTVDEVTGYTARPRTPKVYDGWVLWRGNQREGGAAFMNTWAVVIVLPTGDEVKADAWIEAHEDEIYFALEPVMFVEAFTPSVVPVANSDSYALMITGRSE